VSATSDNTAPGTGFRLGVSFIGTLSEILSNLHGYDTLAFELIQNADDAKGTDIIPAATRIRFEVDDEAVTVWNDSEFTWCGVQDRCGAEKTCDLHSFLEIAGQAKREREDTTGAFGIGFTAVYQITDRPELISPGIHLTLAPEHAGDRERVIECSGCERCASPTGTTFHLPWASEPSPLRAALFTEPVHDPDGFVAELEPALLQALPFLRRVQHIELLHNGTEVGSYHRKPPEGDGDEIQLIGPTGTTTLHRLTGSFVDDAIELRAEPGSPIEDKRSSDIQVLLGDIEPFTGEPRAGRLYAGLPTEERIPARMLLAADFFPHSSRKTITLASDMRSEWNRAALRGGARTVAAALPRIVTALDPLATWELIASFRETAEELTDPAYRDFWQIVAAAARHAEILPRPSGELVAPEDTMFVPAPADDVALDLLEELGATVPDPALREVLSTLPRAEHLGMTQLTAGTLASLLAGNDSSDLSDQRRRQLWELMNRMIDRESDRSRESGRKTLSGTVTAPRVGGGVELWSDIRRSDGRQPAVLSAHIALLDEAPLDGLRNVIDLAPVLKVGDLLDSLETAEGLTDELELLTWFADRRAEFEADSELGERLGELALFPADRDPGAAPEFLPLERISLAEDRGGVAFEDPIGIADVLDLTIGDELVDFIRLIGIERLDLARYIRSAAIPALEETDEPHPAWLDGLLQLLAEHLGELRSEPDLLGELREAALIPCSDRNRRRPEEVYFAKEDVVAVLGDSVAYEAAGRGLGDLLDELGVAGTPRPSDVVARIRTVCASAPTASARATIRQILRHIAAEIPQHEDHAGRATLKPVFERRYGELKQVKWLPAHGVDDRWFAPDAGEIYRDNQQHLFASQAKFLDVPPELRNAAANVLEVLGVEAAAPLPLIVRHLLHCAGREPPHPDIYRRLNDSLKDVDLTNLRSAPCLYLSDGQWARPGEVFWDAHHLAPYAHRLEAAAWDQWRPLLNALGVRDVPDHEDAARVLAAVAEDHRDDEVDEATEALIHHCWALVDSDLNSALTGPTWVSSHLAGISAVVDGHRRLAAPAEVFVDDHPELGRRLTRALGPGLITRPRGTWTAMQAAGVRGLRECTRPEVRIEGHAVVHGVLRRLIKGLEAQIARVIEDAAGSGAVAPAFEALDGLSLLSTQGLEARWIFEPDRRITTPFEQTEVVFDPHAHCMYIDGELSGPIWIDICRELSAAIAPDAPTLTLLKEVLEAEDADHADAILDRYGIARLTATFKHLADEAAVAPGTTPTEPPADDLVEADADGVGADETAATNDEDALGGEHEGSRKDERDDEHPEAVGSEESGSRGDHDASYPGSDQPEGAGGAHGGRRRTTTGTRSGGGAGIGHSKGEGDAAGVSSGGDGRRSGATGGSRGGGQLVSYVEPREKDDHGEGHDQRARDAVGEAGVDLVCEELASYYGDSRIVKKMPDRQKGYDIEVRYPDGNVVDACVEVKSLRGEWGLRGVWVSSAQFEEAREPSTANRFVLAVVEQVYEPIATIHFIEDPAHRIDKYCFDYGWAQAADRRIEVRGAELSATAVSDDVWTGDARADELIAAVVAAGLPEPETAWPFDGVPIAAAWPDDRIAIADGTALADSVPVGWEIRPANDWTEEELIDALRGGR
jgi:hypothetical protein